MLRIPPNGAVAEVSAASSDNSNVDFTIEAGDILNAEFTEKAGDNRASGTMTLDNRTGKFTTGEKPVRFLDRIKFITSPEQEGLAFGEGPFGSGAFGGWTVDGDFLVREITRNRKGSRTDVVELRLTDFVFGIMSQRRVTYRNTDRTISGSPSSILNTILRQKVPEIDRSRLPVLDQRIDYFAEDKSVAKIVDDLAGICTRYYGQMVTYSFGDSLRFEPVTELDVIEGTVLNENDFTGEPVSETTDRGFYNNVRVIGGIDDENKISDSQEVIDTYTTPGPNNRIMTPIDTAKSEISKVDLYTYADSGGSVDNGVRVRIQLGKKDGSGPIAPGDDDKDIVNSGEQKVAYELDGYTQFTLGKHSIPDREIWLIIDSAEAPAGYDIGAATDSNGNITGPTYIAYFPKPVGIERPDRESIQQTRQVDGSIKNKALASGKAVRDTAEAALNRHTPPPQRFEPENCETLKAHQTKVGSVAKIEGYEDILIGGYYLATERTRKYENGLLSTDLTFQGVKNT